MDTTQFLIVDFRLIWRGEMVYFIISQFLKTGGICPQGFFMKNHLKEKTGSAPLAGSPSAAGSESYLTLSCRRFVDPAHPVLFSMWHWYQELFHEKTLICPLHFL